MITCPNRTRKKRLGPGGGALGCRGRLEVHVPAAVIVPLKSWGRGRDILPRFEDAFPARVRKRGVRIRPETIHASYTRQAGADVRCSACGWSLNRMVDGLNRAAHKRLGRRAA